DDSTTAEQVWENLAAKYPNTVDADHALFWLGKLTAARGDKAKADAFLQEASKPPRSYYSYRALDLLGRPDAAPSFDVNNYTMNSRPELVAGFEKWLAGWTGGAAVSGDLTPAVLSDFHFRRGSELAELDQAADARIEFSKVNDRFSADARSLYSLARYYSDNNYFDLSIAAANQIKSLSGTPDEQLPRYLRELIYPTYYANLVVPYAQRAGFDPMLFFALMRQESMYNPLAKSWVGATGLTQVMPGTGAGIARELGVGNFKITDLLKPYNSVRFGTYYLGQLYKNFDGNSIYALAGYNAGPGNVKKWIRPDMDVAVELIHLSETYHYVRTIYSQYNQYQEIYGAR
ncbi:MAG: transglycosylase SLT domain-containing protein, partial [Rudaea sp.]